MDLTNFNYRHHNLQLEILQGDLVETEDGIFPLVHIMLWNDDYQYALKHAFVGFKMFDDDGVEHIVTGENQAKAVVRRIEHKGRVNLENWKAADDALLASMGIGCGIEVGTLGSLDGLI